MVSAGDTLDGSQSLASICYRLDCQIEAELGLTCVCASRKCLVNFLTGHAFVHGHSGRAFGLSYSDVAIKKEKDIA